jgi:hypothetical protein
MLDPNPNETRVFEIAAFEPCEEKNNGPNMLPIASKEILKINHAIGICSGGLRSSSGARALRRPAGTVKNRWGLV